MSRAKSTLPPISEPEEQVARYTPRVHMRYHSKEIPPFKPLPTARVVSLSSVFLYLCQLWHSGIVMVHLATLKLKCPASALPFFGLWIPEVLVLANVSEDQMKHPTHQPIQSFLSNCLSCHDNWLVSQSYVRWYMILSHSVLFPHSTHQSAP